MGLSDSARAKLDQAKQMRSELIQENSKVIINLLLLVLEINLQFISLVR